MNKKLSRIYLLATFTVALFYNQSIVAQSLSFDGVDDRVELPSAVLNGLSEFTFEAWFYPDGNQSGLSNIIQHDGSNYKFYIRYEDDMSQFSYDLKIGSEGQVNITSPDINSWHHVAFSYDGNTATA